MARTRRLTALTVLLATLAAAHAAHADSPPTANAPAPIDETKPYSDTPTGQAILSAAKKLEEGGFTGAILAARDGKVVAATGLGKNGPESATDNTPATLFEIASLTKSFTAAAVLRLAQRDPAPLALTDPVSKHLPGVPDDCKAITVEHLLRHTSGIPGDNAEGHGTDLARVLPTFLEGGPRHKPGTRFEYWNQGYALLSEIIARASGTPYTDFCRTELFAPAGMRSTCFTGDKAPAGAVVATGRSRIGPARSALAHPYGEYGFQYRGMGGIVTSVWDLWRWDRALHDAEAGKPGALLTPASIQALFKPGPGDYALGWRITTDARGRLVQSHGGAVRGFVCELRRYPKQDALLAILCNRDDAPTRDAAATIEALLFGDPAPAHPHDAKVKSVDPKLQAALAGVYRDALGRTLTLETDGPAVRGRLDWSTGQGGGPVTRLTVGRDASGALVMFDGVSSERLTLDRAADGAVQSIKVLTLTFNRAKP